MADPETWEQFKAQPTTAEWGHFVHISGTAKAEAYAVAMQRLSQSMALGAWRRGYRLRADTMQRLVTAPGRDVLCQSGSMAVKGSGSLEPDPAQFIVWAEALVATYRQRAEQAEHALTWLGFLRYQWRRFMDWWRPVEPWEPWE